ncbi:hypothetical protein B296_00023087 [Ensete ventricosum]|uniref:Uncharacterized protein n=1 Tax=Ensete ventricosum TaxID=4639 RepID=A0A426XRM2_ENSVE|nr:hypothetical protein B296_00023087 [Ensete ventricosum]
MELQPGDGPRSSLGIGSGSDDAVEPRREFARRFAKGIEKLAGNTLGDHRKKTIGLTIRMLEAAELGGSLTMTGAMELQPDNGTRSSLGIGPSSDDTVEPHREFARRFTKGIEKLAGNMLGNHRKKTIGLTARMLVTAGLCRS